MQFFDYGIDGGCYFCCCVCLSRAGPREYLHSPKTGGTIACLIACLHIPVKLCPHFLQALYRIVPRFHNLNTNITKATATSTSTNSLNPVTQNILAIKHQKKAIGVARLPAKTFSATESFIKHHLFSIISTHLFLMFMSFNADCINFNKGFRFGIV